MPRISQRSRRTASPAIPGRRAGVRPPAPTRAGPDPDETALSSVEGRPSVHRRVRGDAAGDRRPHRGCRGRRVLRGHRSQALGSLPELRLAVGPRDRRRGSPGIGAFAPTEEAWPDWADPSSCGRANGCSASTAPRSGMGLFMASLPSDYAFANGVQALARTTRLSPRPQASIRRDRTDDHRRDDAGRTRAGRRRLSHRPPRPPDARGRYVTSSNTCRRDRAGRAPPRRTVGRNVGPAHQPAAAARYAVLLQRRGSRSRCASRACD